MTGYAPCTCGWFDPGIPLTGEKKSDGIGGWYWTIQQPYHCEGCGEVNTWMHEPAPQELVFTLQEVEVENTK